MKVFVEIPVCLTGGDKGEEKEEVGRIDPREIAFYYPGYNWGSMITMKSGSTFLTTLEAAEIDQLIVQFSDTIKKNPATKGVLRMIRKEVDNASR